MRRGLASLIMGLSLLVASASWAGFVMSHTVLDPGRSERLADHLLEDPEVRAAVADRIADALQSQVPKGVAIPRQNLQEAANLALDDPRVRMLVRDGIVRAHQNALNGVDEPIALDAGVVGEAGRAALVQLAPTLDPLLPAAPQLAVEVPGTGLSWLGTVKDYVDRFTLLGALAAGAGLVASFLITTRRAAALRRVSFWGFGASAFWLVAAYGLPGLVGFIAPSAMAIASAVVDVFAGAMIRPALVMAGISAALLMASIVWPARERRRPAAMIDKAGPGSGARGGRPRGRAARPMAAAAYPVPPAGPAAYPVPPAGPVTYPGFAPPPEPTMQYPVISSGTGGGPDPAPTFGQEPRTTPLWPAAADAGASPDPGGGVWVEGVGYIDPRTPTADPYGATQLAPEPYRAGFSAPPADSSEDPTLTAAPVVDQHPPR